MDPLSSPSPSTPSSSSQFASIKKAKQQEIERLKSEIKILVQEIAEIEFNQVSIELKTFIKWIDEILDGKKTELPIPLEEMKGFLSRVERFSNHLCQTHKEKHCTEDLDGISMIRDHSSCIPCLGCGKQFAMIPVNLRDLWMHTTCFSKVRQHDIPQFIQIVRAISQSN